MAISSADCLVWRTLRRAGLIPQSPRVLEIGRANWYGDVSPEEVEADQQEFAPSLSAPGNLDLWAMADWYYSLMLRDPQRVAIDLDPAAPHCLRHDLNEPVSLGQCDIVINTGTCEHVFDQRQVWQTIHDSTKLGGLMVHAMPLWGWLDHGFINYQPTFVADLAAENGYEILLWLFAESNPPFTVPVHEVSDFQDLFPRSRNNSAMMYVVFRRTRDDEFRVPMQGVYSSRAGEKLLQNWRKRGGIVESFTTEAQRTQRGEEGFPNHRPISSSSLCVLCGSVVQKSSTDSPQQTQPRETSMRQKLLDQIRQSQMDLVQLEANKNQALGVLALSQKLLAELDKEEAEAKAKAEAEQKADAAP